MRSWLKYVMIFGLIGAVVGACTGYFIESTFSSCQHYLSQGINCTVYPYLGIKMCLSGLTIGAIIGWLFDKREKMKTWLKEGLIGAVIFMAISYFFYIFTHALDPAISVYGFFYDHSVSFYFHETIASLFYGFIMGVIIGWIYDKIKSQKRNKDIKTGKYA